MLQLDLITVKIPHQIHENSKPIWQIEKCPEPTYIEGQYGIYLKKDVSKLYEFVVNKTQNEALECFNPVNLICEIDPWLYVRNIIIDQYYTEVGFKCENLDYIVKGDNLYVELPRHPWKIKGICIEILIELDSDQIEAKLFNGAEVGQKDFIEVKKYNQKLLDVLKDRKSVNIKKKEKNE